jgi:hypothetical protein
MTNFEKWKNELVPEKLLYSGFHSGNPYKAAIFACPDCPADSCPRKNLKCIIHDAICQSEFLKWAESAEYREALLAKIKERQRQRLQWEKGDLFYEEST